MRGAKPKPTIVKLISQSHNIRKDIESEPMPEGELYLPPDDLCDAEKKIWNDTISVMPEGLLRLLDESIFKLWVEAWHVRNQAKREMGSNYTVITPNGLVQKSAWLSIIDQQTVLIHKLSSEMGFTPTSRSRIISAATGNKKNANRFANNAIKKTG